MLALAVAGGSLIMVARYAPVLDPLVDSSTMIRRLVLIGSERDTSVNKRLSSFEAALRASRERPLLGWGPENFLVAWGRHVDADLPNEGHFDHAHNKILEELTTTGTLGLLSYAMVWVAMASVVLRSVRRRRDHEQLLVLAVGSALLAFFVQNLSLFDSPVTVMQLSVLIAFVVSDEGRLGRRESVSPAGDPTADDEPPSPAHPIPPRGPSRLIRTPAGAAASTLAIIVLTGAALMQFNVRPYDAALWARLAVGADSFTEAARYLQQSVRTSPPLANLTRVVVLNQTSARVRSMSGEEFAHAVAIVGTEGPEALRIEPQNWRVHAALAQFYQHIAQSDPAYLQPARAHVREVLRLAPHTQAFRALEARQCRRESSWGRECRPLTDERRDEAIAPSDRPGARDGT